MTVGRELRAAREKMGWTLEDLETSLKIRFSVLQAIEDSRFDVLPGSAYGLGFVRAYARFLRLDAEEMVRRFKAEAGAFGTPAQLSFPSPEYESRLPRDVVIIASIVVAAVAYGAWYYTTASERAPIPRVAAVPEQLAALASLPPGPSSASPSQAEAAAMPGNLGAPGAVAPEASHVEPPAETAAPDASQVPNVIAPPLQVVEVPVRPVVPPPPLAAPAPTRANAPAPTVPRGATPQPAAPAAQPPAAPAPRQAANPTPGPVPAAPPAPSAPMIAQAPSPAPQTTAPAVGQQPAGPGAAPPPPPPSLIFAAPTTGAQSAPVIAAVPRPPEATQNPASGITLTPPAARAPDANEPRIFIRATAEVWVEVRDQAGKPVFMKLMRRGESYGVPNRGGLTMSAGRASAVTMTVDGEPVEVARRSVGLDADALKQSAAARRTGG
jgi:cytoskeleton protein RodZ